MYYFDKLPLGKEVWGCSLSCCSFLKTNWGILVKYIWEELLEGWEKKLNVYEVLFHMAEKSQDKMWSDWLDKNTVCVGYASADRIVEREYEKNVQV